MAKIILPYTIQNGNTADGGQVQQDFDAILTQVNGNLDNANLADGAVSTTKLVDGAVTEAKLATDAVTEAKIKDGAVTAAKLASDIKIIENVYSTTLSSTVDVNDGTEKTILSQSLSLTDSRYCLFLITEYYSSDLGSQVCGKWQRLYSDSTKFFDQEDATYHSISSQAMHSFHCFARLSAGSPTIYLKIRESGDTLHVYAGTCMTIIQFAF